MKKDYGKARYKFLKGIRRKIDFPGIIIFQLASPQDEKPSPRHFDYILSKSGACFHFFRPSL